MKISLDRAFLAVSIIAGMSAVSVMADSTWDGGGTASAPNWSTGANWVGDGAPSTSAGGTITFNNTALGSTNVVDQNYTISSLVYDNTTAGSAHTTVVASASTLLINGSILRVGYRQNNVLAVIKGGGTVQLGDATHPVDLYVEVGDDGGLYTGSSLIISSTLNVSNLNNFYVGRQTTGGGGATGSADLSGSTIDSGSTPNKLRVAGILGIGEGGGRNPIGTLTLPSSLTDIDVGTFDMASGLVDSPGRGTLDLGSGSQLNHFTAANGFYLGNDGAATLLNWPTDVVMSIGTPGTPVPMVVGYSRYTPCGGILALTNGSFTAYLSSLIVGDSTHYNARCTGILDLASTTVQIGNTPNKVQVPVLNIGAGAGSDPYGILKLPPAITEITVGTFDLGSGCYGDGTGILDLGAGSQLTAFTASNAFYMGNNAIVAITSLPANVVFSIGTPSTPAPMVVGASAYSVGRATLAVTNGSFTAYLSLLRVGYSTTQGGGGSDNGMLDLASTTVQIGNAANKVRVPELSIAGGGGRSATGTIKLPPAITEITVGTLDMGSGYVDGKATATLDLGVNSQLASFTVSNACYLGNAGSSTIVGWPANVAVSIGTVNTPAPMVVGVSGYSANCNGGLVLTNGSFAAHLAYLNIGCNTRGDGNGSAIGILDLSQTAMSAFSVTGDVSIGYVPGQISYYAHGYVYLPQGSATIGGSLYIGDSTSYGPGSGLLVLSNTQVTVSNTMVMDVTGVLTNYVNGLSSGINLQTTNLNITANGAMNIRFLSDPQTPSLPYWGLCLKGNVITQMNALTTTPAKVAYDISGLSAKNQQKFGVYYDLKNDRTFLGLEGVAQGTVFVVH